MKKMSTKKEISLLWVFVMFNYLYCDILTLMDPRALQEVLSGSVGTMQITEGFLLSAAILMEIPILMVLLSRTLKYKTNRYANIIAGTIMTLVQAMSLFIGSLTMYYIFFSVIEIATTAFIVKLAWKWSDSEIQTESTL